MLQSSTPILMAAASPAFLAKGCVNVIELDSFKDKAGARWSRISEGVYNRLEALLREKLGPNDLFVRLGDTAYLVTMPTTDPEDVNAVCLRVAFDLHMFYLGECELSQIEVNSVSSGDDSTLVLKRLPVETITRLADKAGITELMGRRGIPNDDFADSAAGKSPVKKAPRPSEADNPVSIEVEHQFIPIWSVANSAVTMYACEPKTILVSGRPDPIPLSMLSSRRRSQVEMSCFHAGITQLAKSYTTRNRFLLAVPISFEVLGSPAGRMELLSACRNLSQNYRQYLIFLIYDVPPGVAQSRLATMVCSLLPFARSVVATIAPTSRVYPSYNGIGLRAVGFDLKEFNNKTPFCQKDAEQLSQFARRSDLGTFLMNVREKDTLKWAQDANIQTLSGPLIAPPSPEPNGIWRLTWADRLSQPAVEIWI